MDVKNVIIGLTYPVNKAGAFTSKKFCMSPSLLFSHEKLASIVTFAKIGRLLYQKKVSFCVILCSLPLSSNNVIY